jgi:general secretion pathway protein B
MSYILEALKRAEAERDRGAVPTLHSQPTTATVSTAQAPRSTPWIALLSALLVLALAAVAALWWRGRGDTTPAVALSQSSPPPPVAAVTAPAPPPAPIRAKPEPAPKPPAPRPAIPAKPPVADLPPPAPQPTAPAPSTTQPSRIYTLAELPADVRQQLPKLSINGASYSERPESRMLIVNGQVFHEKDEVTPGLVVESIGPKHAVLRFAGYRFSQAF